MKSISNYNQLDDKDINLTKANNKKRNPFEYIVNLETLKDTLNIVSIKHSKYSLKIYKEFQYFVVGGGVGMQGHQDDM